MMCTSDHEMQKEELQTENAFKNLTKTFGLEPARWFRTNRVCVYSDYFERLRFSNDLRKCIVVKYAESSIIINTVIFPNIL